MKNIVSITLLIPMIVFVQELHAESTVHGKITKPALPITRPVHPVIRPIVNTGLVHQDNNYYTTVESSCENYIEIINQKDQEIQALKKEIESLKNKEHSKIQKNLKEEYDKEMEKFENRKMNTNTKSDI